MDPQLATLLAHALAHARHADATLERLSVYGI
jgi:hypothetical protein